MHFGNIVCFVNQLLFPVYEKTNNAAIFSFYLNCKTAQLKPFTLLMKPNMFVFRF
jgi:hypothetical protein